MLFAPELKRLLTGFLTILLLIVAIVAYLAVVEPDTLLSREDNPRRVEQIAAIDRGNIYDRDGRLLVTSQPAERSDEMTRVYLEPAVYGTVGYYSLRYGVSGAEAAYNALLSGSDMPETLDNYFEENVLHRARQGGDIRLTLDLVAQQTLVDSLIEAGCRFQTETEAQSALIGCAGVVLSVPDGGVLAMTSLPTYDPNVLDSEWDQLVQDDAQPFFNRVLQGQYQPGTLSQFLLMTLGFIKQVDMERIYINATDVVRVGEVAQVCIASPPTDDLTLPEAFIYGCPMPFSHLINSWGMEEVTKGYALFQVDTIPQLAGFLPEQASADSDEELKTIEWTLDDILGQGEVTVTPLQLATILSAYINDGNGIYPHILLEERQPDSTEWEVNPTTLNRVPLTTSVITQQMQELMAKRLEIQPMITAKHEGYDMGGMVAVASSGDTTQVWFIGWAKVGSRDGVVAVILLDNSDELESAAKIGGDVLVNALEARQDHLDESP